MNLDLTLLIDGKKDKPTTLCDGDILVVQECGTVGFHRDGRRLHGIYGDDKVLASGVDVRSFLQHFGITTKLVENAGSASVKAYRLSRSAHLKNS